MSRPPFGDPGVCPTIALFSSTTNQSPIGGLFSTTWIRLSAEVIATQSQYPYEVGTTGGLRREALFKLQDRRGIVLRLPNHYRWSEVEAIGEPGFLNPLLTHAGGFSTLPPPLNGGVAQLVRALPCHGRGCGFESRRSRQHLLAFPSIP